MNVRPYNYLRRVTSPLLVDHSTAAKIRGFSKFESGWHYTEGVPFSEEAIEDALALHREILISGFDETDAFPGLSGEIQLTAYWENDYFEFTREPDGS